MIAVADTSPLNYLVLIDEIDLLPFLFQKILLPRAVFQELLHPKASPKVRAWAENLPRWIELRDPASPLNHTLMDLDPGEREAIQLALENNTAIVLIDEAQGRLQAQSFHLEVRGTLGVLERGAKLGRIDLQQAIGRLRRTNFRISAAVYEAVVRRNQLSITP